MRNASTKGNVQLSNIYKVVGQKQHKNLKSFSAYKTHPQTQTIVEMNYLLMHLYSRVLMFRQTLFLSSMNEFLLD